MDDGAGAVAPGAVVSGPAVLEPTREEWQAAAKAALEYAARNMTTFTVDDIEEMCGRPPAGSAWQGALLKAVHHGIIEKTNLTAQSVKPSRKGGYIGVYRGLMEDDQ